MYQFGTRRSAQRVTRQYDAAFNCDPPTPSLAFSVTSLASATRIVQRSHSVCVQTDERLRPFCFDLKFAGLMNVMLQ
jgi:hypothetical protein